jgi:hypothetical protein
MPMGLFCSRFLPRWHQWWLMGSTLVFLQFININCSSTVAYCNRKGGDRAYVVEQELVDQNIDLTMFQPLGYLFHNA